MYYGFPPRVLAVVSDGYLNILLIIALLKTSVIINIKGPPILQPLLLLVIRIRSLVTKPYLPHKRGSSVD